MSDLPAYDVDLATTPAADRVIAPDRTRGDPQIAPRRGREGDTLDGERSISPVAGRSGAGRAGKLLALLGLLVGCGAFLAATWTHPKAPKTAAGADEPVRQVVDFDAVRAATTRPPAPLPDVDGAVSTPTLAAPGAGAPSLAGAGAVVPAIAVDGADAKGVRPAATDAVAARKAAAARDAAVQQATRLRVIRAAPLLAYSAGAAPQAAGGHEPSSVALHAAAAAEASSELDQLRRGSAIGLVRATRLPDPDVLLSAGAVIPCVLETALDTSAPGFVTCRIPKDVYSDSGGVVLLEKGSRVIGEYRSGFQQGRARIFVLWDRIATPGGVAVDVASPASDALGRAGFDGRIDSHFWRRFGGALLLTSVSGCVSAAATADARFASVAQAPNEAAAVALQNSINIPPTLSKPQGAEVGIFVSRDLDFSSVYALKGR